MHPVETTMSARHASQPCEASESDVRGMQARQVRRARHASQPCESCIRSFLMTSNKIKWTEGSNHRISWQFCKASHTWTKVKCAQNPYTTDGAVGTFSACLKITLC